MRGKEKPAQTSRISKRLLPVNPFLESYLKTGFTKMKDRNKGDAYVNVGNRISNLRMESSGWCTESSVFVTLSQASLPNP